MRQRITSFISLFFLSLLMSPLAFASYDHVVEWMKGITAQYPQEAELFVLGENDQSQLIQGLKIEKSGPYAPKTPRLVVAAHHGNEEQSVDVAKKFVEELLTKDELLETDVFYVLPVLNINGFNESRREESHRSGETMDPNRDYPDPCREDTPFKLKSTKLLADFVTAQNITSAVSIHGYIGSFTFPWGTYTTQSQTLDHHEFTRVANLAVVHNGYEIGTHNDVIYPTVGAFEDWAYYEHGVWSMLLEMRMDQEPEKDSRSLIEFFAQSPRTRSANHQHGGKCKHPLPENILSRP